MAINDDFYDIRAAIERLRKDRGGLLMSLKRIMARLDELEAENQELRQAAKVRQGGAE